MYPIFLRSGSVVPVLKIRIRIRIRILLIPICFMTLTIDDKNHWMKPYFRQFYVMRKLELQESFCKGSGSTTPGLGSRSPVVFDPLELEPVHKKNQELEPVQKKTRSRSRQKCAAPFWLRLLKVKSRRILNIFFLNYFCFL